MGCAGSVTDNARNSCKDMVKSSNSSSNNNSQPVVKVSYVEDMKHSELSEAERAVLMKTWSFLSADMQGHGMQVWLRIFEICPETKKLFSVENVRHSELARNIIINAHASRFMNAIGAAMNNLKDLETKLSRHLILLGHQHKLYEGFRPAYFEVFYEALMWHWERALGAQLTTEIANAWSHLFVVILGRLQEGYRIHGQPTKTPVTAFNRRSQSSVKTCPVAIGDNGYATKPQEQSLFVLK